MNPPVKPSYDMVRDAFTEIYSKRPCRVTKRFETLPEICETVDKFAIEMGAIEVSAGINSATLELTISVVCEDCDLRFGKESRFVHIAMLMDSIKFSKSELSTDEIGYLKVSFCANGIFAES